MHSKLKGNLGELKVVAVLASLGFSVFAELGDYSRIDLIAEKDGKLLKIQVKASNENKGVYVLRSRKTGPNNYIYYYTVNDFDFFALYCIQDDVVVWIPSKTLCSNTHNTISFRSLNYLAKDKRKLKINNLIDYIDLNKCLLDL